MTDEAIEAAARAMCECHGVSPEKTKHEYPRSWDRYTDAARAAAPALMEEGARLALEAAEYAFVAPGVWTQPWKVLRKLDPATIVKGTSHDRD